MRKLRPQEAESLAQGHTVRKQRTWDSKPANLAPDFRLFPPHCPICQMIRCGGGETPRPWGPCDGSSCWMQLWGPLGLRVCRSQSQQGLSRLGASVKARGLSRRASPFPQWQRLGVVCKARGHRAVLPGFSSHLPAMLLSTGLGP